jgi:hypothetical protein
MQHDRCSRLSGHVTFITLALHCAAHVDIWHQLDSRITSAEHASSLPPSLRLPPSAAFSALCSSCASTCARARRRHGRTGSG